MTRHAALAAAIAFTALAGVAFAAGPSILKPEQIDPARILPPPPEDGTPPAIAEWAELRRLQEDRTPARLEQARSDDKTEDASIFAKAFGPGFKLDALPATAKLMQEVRVEEKAAASAAKSHFKRNRPWIVDASLDTCSREDPPQTSYPSGHATMGYSMAVVLAAAAPDKARALMSRADEYAESRLVCAMHFRRDITAGQVLGTVVAYELIADPRFQADLEAARQELKAAGLTGG